MTKFDKAQERVLFRRLADGLMTAQEFSVVEQRLRTDASFRTRYLCAMNMEASLYEAFNFPGTFSVEETRKGSHLAVWTITASCVIGLLGLTGLLLRAPEKTGELVANLKPVAIVTRVDSMAETVSTTLIPGTRIKPGTLLVESGQAQLEFLNGAQINLQGPAELRIVSGGMATLVSGKAAVRIPRGARGFILSTPDAAIVDLGTEFAVSVGPQGGSEVHVVEGDVDVSLLGKDGNTLTSERISEAKTLRVNRRSAGLQRLDQPGVTFPVIQSQESAPLSVSEEYVQSVRASQPTIYWRFEKLVDGNVPNEISPQWTGRIVSERASAITVRGGVARFSPMPDPCRIEPEESIPGLNRDSFTIEFWVSPDCFHGATLVAVVPADPVGRSDHLSLIELAYQTSLVYPPGSFRFLHRYPPGTNGGFNLFSEGDCTPGFWHHIVAVKTPVGMTFFVNGQRVRHFAEATGSDEAAYRILVGALNETGDRQFSGALDEFALYRRALDEQEIREHYGAMTAKSAAKLANNSFRNF